MTFPAPDNRSRLLSQMLGRTGPMGRATTPSSNGAQPMGQATTPTNNPRQMFLNKQRGNRNPGTEPPGMGFLTPPELRGGEFPGFVSPGRLGPGPNTPKDLFDPIRTIPGQEPPKKNVPPRNGPGPDPSPSPGPDPTRDYLIGKARGFMPYAAGNKVYTGGGSSNVGPVADKSGYRQRDQNASLLRNAMLRRLQANQQGRFMNSDSLRDM